MNTNHLIIALSIALLSAVSCVKENKELKPQVSDVKLTFRAGFGNWAETKTTVKNGSEIWWTPNDAINVFYGELTSGKFVALCAQESATTSFTGSLSMATGAMESGADTRSFWAVYPYNADNECDGNGVTLTVPKSQKGAEGSFAQNMFPAIAQSTGLDLAFYNVCGGLVFTVTRNDIKSVSLKGRNGESLAGTINTTFVNERPAVNSIISGDTEITLKAPDNKQFVAGTKYYITSLPVSFTKGYELTFITKDGAKGTKTVKESKTINRSRFLVVNNADSGVSFAGGSVDTKNIQFADDAIKEKLVAAFDKDGDGELSYEEAAAVTRSNALMDAFGDSHSFKSFDEFQYFTGITTVTSNLFQNWTLLTSIILPETITSIESRAFQNCSKLASLLIPDCVSYIGSYAFSGCASLTAATIPGKIMIINSYTFESCSNITTIIIPNGVKEIGSYAFSKCAKLSSVSLPSSLSIIDSYAFNNCESLSNVYLEDVSIIESFNKGTYYHTGSPMLSTEEQVHLYIAGKEVTEISLPEGMTEVPDGCLRNCAFISTVHIPEGVTSIGKRAFYGCTGLSSITIPDGVSSVGSYAFYGCTGLSSITIPDGVSSIGSCAFYNCTGLSSVTIEAKDVPNGDYSMFYNTGNCPIFVPEESVDAYKAAKYWSDYSGRIMAKMDDGDDHSVINNVTAYHSGGAVTIINGIIQSGSQISYSVKNNSDKAIKVLNIQLVDGETGQAGNVMSINKEIEPGGSSGWTVTIGSAGIHAPTAVFMYTCEGKLYVVKAKYTSISL